MDGWHISVSGSPWAVMGSAALLGAVGILSWKLLARCTRGDRARGVRPLVTVEAMRWAASVAVAFTFFRPELVRRRESREKPRVVILCDASRSMQTRDVPRQRETGAHRAEEGTRPHGTSLTRRQWVQQQCDRQVWHSLESRYRVTIEDIAVPPPPEDTSAEEGTDLNAALEKALAQYPDLRAVVLLSDGDWTLGQSPITAATRFALRGVPLFAVTVGSDAYLPDLEIRKVTVPAYALVDEQLSLPFTIQSRLPRDVRTTVVVEGPDGREAEREIVIPAHAECHQTIVLTPRRVGEFDFVLRVPVEHDEAFHDNNAQQFRIAFRTELLKVLVVESAPRWEFRFLRNAFVRDPGVEVWALLLHPGLAVGGGYRYLSAFPAREELTQYDVVFLGDVGVGPGELTPEQAECLRGLVEQQASGLVFLPGPRGRQLTLNQTALADLLPIEWDLATSASGALFTMESHLTLTQKGREHHLTLLADTGGENETVWRTLPGFWWYAPVLRAKPGADVLAVHAATRNVYGRIPLLVTRRAGNGKVLFLGTDSAWRWRRGVEDVYHYRFWGQVVRWMAHQRHMAHREGIRFFFTPESPQRGDRVFLHATVYGPDGFPLREGRVRATLAAPGGAHEETDLTPIPGEWGVFTGSFVARESGVYSVEVACPVADRRVQTELRVRSPRREPVGRPARPDVLREMAEITGGRCVSTEDLATLVRSLELLPPESVQEERMRLWCHPVWLALILFLLGVHWIGRKGIGMV